MSSKRENWGSKIGVILAVAGSAVGLGNFLRFPAKATLNGGGAFMIPYLIAFFLIGIPLIWIEWTLGKMGGIRGKGTAPSVFDSICKNRYAKYLGILGIVGPLVILFYYMFIESWTLAYAYFSFTNKLFVAGNQEGFKSFLSGFQGIEQNNFFTSVLPAYIFFLITFFINFYFIYKGVQGGIEKLSKIGMPILILLGIMLVIRTLSLGTPDLSQPELSVTNALNFVWTPDFSKLKNAQVWLEASGQIFFTLSIGIGVIIAYASYLKKEDDIVLSGLSAGSANEFCEVILGGSIIIPAAFVFLGSSGALEVAKSGTFNIGFVTMPMIFGKIPFGAFFAGCWFTLLFIAGITSSVSLIQPAISFLEDELNISKKKATLIIAIICFIVTQPVIFFLKYGFVDELDFWGGTVFLVLFATIEAIIFSWVLGIEKGWEEIHQGAKIKIPSFYKFIMKYITPLYLIFILIIWTYQQFIPTILMKGVSPENKPYVLGARILVFSLLICVAILIKIIWSKKKIKHNLIRGCL